VRLDSSASVKPVARRARRMSEIVIGPRGHGALALTTIGTDVI
jgi:hypothetical protein